MLVEELKKIIDDTEIKKRTLFGICLNTDSRDDYSYMANILELQAYQKVKGLIKKIESEVVE